MDYATAKRKYTAIKARNFKPLLDLFLICCYLDNKKLTNATFEHFKTFSSNDARIPEARKAYQLSKDDDLFMRKPVSDLDQVIKDWLGGHDLKEYNEYFLSHKIVSQKDFIDFYGEDKQPRECEWCHIKESEINGLIEKGLIKTKRLRTRGRFMEVDRRNPDQGYIRENLALCCYWCNNAKTDEFNDSEFKPIGKLIGETLKARFKK